MTSQQAPSAASGPLFLADISGYTSFLQSVAVVMAHRLLKSGAAELVGHGAYALITASAASRYDIPTEASVPLVETYEHYSPISAHLYPLREA
ncbi:MAG: hypothetical protein ABIQ05_08680 [Candidatus Limnocylindria bacterium]